MAREKTYSEKLKDPRWQKKRLKILERDNWACTECPCETETLHVHHKKYTGNPWDSPDDDLCTLCSGCHSLEEWLKDTNPIIYAFAKTVNETCIRAWKHLGAICYLKANKPDDYNAVMSIIRDNCKDNNDFNIFLCNHNG